MQDLPVMIRIYVVEYIGFKDVFDAIVAILRPSTKAIIELRGDFVTSNGINIELLDKIKVYFKIPNVNVKIKCLDITRAKSISLEMTRI